MEQNLTYLVEKAGIIGAGGAGFPTHVKLNAKADTVIINGAECEPLLRVDQQLMVSRAKELLEGLELVVAHTGATRGIVALKGHYEKAVEALSALLPAHPKLSIHQMPTFYPAGDEQVIVYEATGRIVPEGGIPLAVGVVVCNVETILGIYDAVNSNLPVIDKYVTLTGAVQSPKTVKVPLGITVGEALALAGGPTVEHYKIINGGPMMGKLVTADSPITKTTKGLIVIPEGHKLLKSLSKDLKQMLREAATACMQCSLCTEVCPRNALGHRLEPHKLMRMAAYGKVCDASYTPMSAFLCVGCRLCEYACVMDLEPWHLNGTLKGTMASQGIRNTMNHQPERVVAFREYKRYPTNKLIGQLGLTAYDVPAPLDNGTHNFGRVSLPLHQGAGAPAEPRVSVGDQVTRGDLIAAIPEGKLGSNLHTSISGRVVAVTAQSITIQV